MVEQSSDLISSFSDPTLFITEQIFGESKGAPHIHSAPHYYERKEEMMAASPDDFE